MKKKKKKSITHKGIGGFNVVQLIMLASTDEINHSTIL